MVIYSRSAKSEIWQSPNAPSFICNPVITDSVGKNSFKFDYSYQYQFRVFQNPDFKGASTIESAVQDWTFFNVHKALKPGKWYWQYAYIKDGEKEWSKSISFTVSGKEVDFVSPPFKEVMAEVKNTHPRILLTPEKVGNVEGSSSLQKKLQKKLNSKIGEKLPALIYDNKEVMAQKRKSLMLNVIRCILPNVHAIIVKSFQPKPMKWFCCI